jgi:Protein of unknown function (DUF3105)
MGAKRSRDERKQRTAEQRRAQQARDRRQRRIVYGISIPIALVIIGLVPFTNWYHAHQRGKQHAVGYVRAATAAAKSAGCTGVRNDRQIPTSVVKTGATVDYAGLTAKAGQALPPTSGPRESNLLADTPAFFAVKSAPHPERAVGNLYHGYIVVWYDKQLPAADVKTLQTASAASTRTLFVPWTRSVFPGGQHVVFTAWDRTQRCRTAATKALTEFVGAYQDDTSGPHWASPTAPSPSGAGTTVTPTTVPTPQTTVTLPVTIPTPTTSVPKVTVTPVR